MKHIKGYTEHIIQESEETAKELPYSTRSYLENRVIPEIGQQKEIFDMIPDGWKPQVPIVDRPIRLYNDNIGMLECILMFRGKDVIVVRLDPNYVSDRKKHGPVEYFTMDRGFADSLTFDPKEDTRMLGLMCMDFTSSIARKLQKEARSRGAFGRF